MKQRNWLDLVRPRSFDKEAVGRSTTIVLEPLERGFGCTLGNALRRVMLSSLPAPAITAWRFRDEGDAKASPEPESSDWLELVLNLKELAFRADEGFDQATGVIAFNGKSAPTAKAVRLPEGIEMSDPGTVSPPPSRQPLALEFVVAMGKGYVPAHEQPPHRVPDGFVAIDALHSPVRSVSYRVESTRLGQSLDYERLILTIETSGMVDGEEAVREAARVLHDQLADFINFEIAHSVPAEEDTPDPLGFDAALLRRVDEMELSVRSSNCMKNENIVYIGDLVTHSEAKLLRVPNFGRKSLNEIKAMLAGLGLSLSMDVPDWPPDDIEMLAKRYGEANWA